MDGYNSSNLFIYNNTLSNEEDNDIERHNNVISHNIFSNAGFFVGGSNNFVSHNILSNGGGISNYGSKNLVSHIILSGGDIDFGGENITISNNIVSDSELHAILVLI
ncbi:MAG: hypothetical protein ACFFCQ_15000 [Promethearchaeota archaeon]